MPVIIFSKYQWVPESKHWSKRSYVFLFNADLNIVVCVETQVDGI